MRQILMFLFGLLTSLAPVWGRGPAPVPNPVRKEDAYAFEEYEDLTELGGNPIPMVHTEMLLFAGIQCRPGFHSVTDEMMDAAKHCAGFGSEDKVSKLKFPEEKVLIQLGGTPFLCMQTCSVQALGMVNQEYHGLNETAVFKGLLQSFSNPGGEMSAFILTRELMECDHKHSPVFPRSYKDCSEAQDFFRCVRRVMLDCSDKYDKYKEQYYIYRTTKKARVKPTDEDEEN